MKFDLVISLAAAAPSTGFLPNLARLLCGFEGSLFSGSFSLYITMHTDDATTTIWGDCNVRGNDLQLNLKFCFRSL